MKTKKARKTLNNGARSEEELRSTYFQTPDEIIKRAFSEARKQRPSRRFREKILKKKAMNALKAKAFGNSMQKSVSQLSKKFPRVDEMNQFYVDILSAIVNVERLKKNLSMLNASSKIIKSIKAQYGRRIYNSGTEAGADAALRELEGRLCSVIKRLGPGLSQLKEDSKKLDEVPNIDFSLRTIVLSGFPNVGKTTLLNRITGAKAKVAAYQFTTTSLNVGYFENKYERIQAIDTPGLLDREKLNDVEEKAVASLKHLATIIVFVVDPTESCGYPLEKQFALLESIRGKFSGKTIIVVANKADVASPAEIGRAEAMESGVVLEGEEHKGANLKEALKGALGAAGS